MEVLVVEFRIKPAHVAEFEEAILRNAKASLDTEPGCKQFDVCRTVQEPELFYLYELYDDEAAVQAHLQSAHFLAMNEATASWVASKLVRRLKLQTTTVN
jgi:(4S)-4-hydroxy-5-phosphonooxypentane-2,3-dione isomerase